MAEMWPREIPEWIRMESRRKAEIEVFEMLEESLGEGWECFYSRPWWGLTPRGGEAEGEADFIVAHPEHGLLFIEVKGGGVDYNPATSGWISVDRDGIPHEIKDPIRQASSCKHQFLNRLQKMAGWPEGFIRFRHGAVFPDCKPIPEGTPTLGGYEAFLFCTARRFEKGLKGWIMERLSDFDPKGRAVEKGPGTAGLAMLRKLVAEPVSLRIPLGRILPHEALAREQMLTIQQNLALSMLSETPKSLITGGAGTGKTLLAQEMAVRLADEGRRVIFLCFNAPLAERVGALLAGYSMIQVCTFHGFCLETLRRAGEAVPGGSDAFDHGIPNRTKRVLASSDAVWDAVLVDEGQDFLPDWWEVIDQCLPENGQGLLRVFYDSNQSIYTRRDDLQKRLGLAVHPLNINLRNTKTIARVTDCLYEGPQIKAAGPLGAPPFCDSEAHPGLADYLAGLVGRLIKDELVPPDDIAVLVSNGDVVLQVGRLLLRQRIRTCMAGQQEPGTITLDTVMRYKGLEAPVVVLAVDRRAANDQELSYVAVSRACSRLFVVGDIRGTRLARALESAITVNT